MAEYEVVREIQNSCANNQMRDVYFDEVETEDPVDYVKNILKSDLQGITVEKTDDEKITVFADCGGLHQKFLFTRI